MKRILVGADGSDGAAIAIRLGDRHEWQYVLCGPPPLMQTAEHVLRDLDGPSQLISSERFGIGAAVATGEHQASVRRLVVLLGAVMVAADALFAA